MCFLIAMEEEPGVRSARAVMAAKIPALYDMVGVENCNESWRGRRES